jgi:hypothetical protein
MPNWMNYCGSILTPALNWLVSMSKNQKQSKNTETVKSNKSVSADRLAIAR